MARPGVPPALSPRLRGAGAGVLVLAIVIGALWSGADEVTVERAAAAEKSAAAAERSAPAKGSALAQGSALAHGAALARPAIAAGDVVVNEIDYDLPGTDDAEFVEILNTSSSDVALGELDLLGINGSTSPGGEYLRIELPDSTLPAGGYFVVGAAGVPNVDLVVPDPGFLQNGAPDAIAIVQSIPSAPENDVLLDSVSYEGDTAGGPSGGGSWTEGSGTGLDDSTTIAHLGISRFADGTDTDVNNVDLSRRCITPGEPNLEASTSCPAPDSGETATPTGGAPTATAEAATSTPTAASSTATDEPSATATAVVETATATAEPPTTTPTEASATATATVPAYDTATPTPFGGPPAATNTALPGVTATVPATPTPVPLAVQLIGFEVSRTRSRAILRWATASEIDHAGFLVYRRSTNGLERLTGRLIPPRGSELRGARYRFVDREAPQRASYWLADVDTAGQLTWHGPVRPPASKHPSVDNAKEGEK